MTSKQHDPKHEPIDINIFQLHEQYISRIKLNPPYQRDDVWKQGLKRQLINSILDKIPIGAIHLVKVSAEQNLGFYVLDAKQRLTAIKQFMNNEFCITWKDKELFYRDLRSNESLLDNFYNYKINLVMYEPMSLTAQGRLIEILNFSKPFSLNEKIYTKNFYVKSLIKWLLTNKIKNFSSLSRFYEDKRMEDIRWGHRLLYIALGSSFDDTCDMTRIKNSGKRGLQNSAQKLQEKILLYVEKNNFEDHILENDDAVENMLKSMGLSEKIKKISNYSEAIYKILNQNLVLSKASINSWLLIYLLSFILSKDQDRIITPSFMLENKEEFKKMFSDYIIFVKKNDLSKRHTQLAIFNQHNEWLNKKFSELEIDRGIKNKNINQFDKVIAELNSDGKCPICGITLNYENVVIDHVAPKSLHSTTNAGAICKDCNNKKSNISLEMATSMANYSSNNVV